MGFWKDLGKAVSRTIDADIERSNEARTKEAKARRLMDEAAELRRRSIFNIDPPMPSRQTAQEAQEERILREIGESYRRERATRDLRRAAEDRREYSLVRHYLQAETREVEHQRDLRRDLNRVRGW